MNYAPFELTKDQKSEKEKQHEQTVADKENTIKQFIKEQGLTNERPTEFLDGSKYYDCPKSGKMYRISVINNYVVEHNPEKIILKSTN